MFAITLALAGCSAGERKEGKSRPQRRRFRDADCRRARKLRKKSADQAVASYAAPAATLRGDTVATKDNAAVAAVAGGMTLPSRRPIVLLWCSANAGAEPTNAAAEDSADAMADNSDMGEREAKPRDLGDPLRAPSGNPSRLDPGATGVDPAQGELRRFVGRSLSRGLSAVLVHLFQPLV